MQDQLEKRSQTRFSVLEYVLAFQNSSNIFARSLMVDISLRGCQIRSREKFDTGDLISIHIPREADESMEIHAEVKYCYKLQDDAIYATGVCFKPKNRSESMFIAHYIYDKLLSNKNNIFNENNE